MNARTQRLDLALEGHQVEEALSAIFHTLLLHRTTGKFNYKTGGRYSVGTLGLEDVDCERINFTYVQIASKELQEKLHEELKGFQESLRVTESEHLEEGIPTTGQIELQFYQKKKAHWPFNAECIPWEVWSITVNLVSLANEHERQVFSQELTEVMSNKILCIAEAMNIHEQYTPKVPSQNELECVYDTTFSDIQPYLFKISSQAGTINQGTVGATMKKIIKDTLTF